MFIKDNKLAIITEPKTIQCNIAKEVGNNLKYETGFTIKQNEF